MFWKGGSFKTQEKDFHVMLLAMHNGSSNSETQYLQKMIPDISVRFQVNGYSDDRYSDPASIQHTHKKKYSRSNIFLRLIWDAMKFEPIW